MIPSTSRIRGFSLVEVTLAIGIFTFAGVALLGLLPAGLKTFEDAIDATVASQIAQGITTQARQAKFSELEQFNGNQESNPLQPEADFFYDEQGQLLGSGSVAPQGTIYTAAVVIANGPPASTSLPGAQPNLGLATVSVWVKKISSPRDSRVTNFLVADNGL
jgi:uncharacterized protein (TIGR02598 family)